MPVSKQLENQHLLWRAGFGPAVYQLDDLYNSSPNKLYNSLQKASSKKGSSQILWPLVKNWVQK